MNPSVCYDAIFVYETDFQKSVVDNIIPVYYEGKNLLLIDARYFQVRYSGKTYSLNLNGFKNTIVSIKALFQFPKLYTKELICTAFTGINSRLFPAIVKHKQLVFIDDGIGTPAILKLGKYPSSRKFVIRYIFACGLLFLLRRRVLSRTKTLIRNAKKYYTIYDFVDGDFSQFIKCLTIIHVNYFSMYKYTLILDDIVGFVSNGLGDKSGLLQEVYIKTGKKPVYFPHPHEDISRIDTNLVLRIERPDTILEKHFMQSGVPAMLFGDPSTVFINLRQSHYPAERIMIYYDKQMMRSAYFDIYRGLGVKLIENH